MFTVTSRPPISCSAIQMTRRRPASCTLSTLDSRGTVDQRSKIKDSLFRQYALDDTKKKGAYRPRPARPHTDFRGTWNYASPAMHDYVELVRWPLISDRWSLISDSPFLGSQGRHLVFGLHAHGTDIWSLISSLIFDLWRTFTRLCRGWTAILSMRSARWSSAWKMKNSWLSCPVSLIFDLCGWSFSSAELIPITKHLRTLDVYNRPNYTLINDCFDKVFTRFKVP